MPAGDLFATNRNNQQHKGEQEKSQNSSRSKTRGKGNPLILGYETKLLGQGKGRVPDGLAVENDNSYAIIWDAKARYDKYSLGTDNRTIREYIVSKVVLRWLMENLETLSRVP